MATKISPYLGSLLTNFAFFFSTQQKKDGRNIPNASSSTKTDSNSLMPPPPPLRKSLIAPSKTVATNPTEPLSKRATIDSSQNSTPKTGLASAPQKEQHSTPLDHIVRMPASIQSRRMSLPYTRMPTLVPKPNGNRLSATLEQSSRQSKSNVVQATSHATSQPQPKTISTQEQTMPQLKTMPTISARPPSQLMPQLKALPILSPRPSGPAIIRKIGGGQNVLLYTTGPLIRTTTQPTGTNVTNTPPFIVGQPQSIPRPQFNGKIASRRYSIAVQPTEAGRPMQMNGITSRPVFTRVIQQKVGSAPPNNHV